MTLALVVIITLVVALLCALLVRRGVFHAYVAVPVVLLLPLAGWLHMQLASAPPRSPWSFDVLGQYHRLSDTVHLATQADADFVLRSGQAGGADVVVWFDVDQARLGVRVARAAGPVLLGDRPVNALPLRRHSQLSGAGGETRAIVQPWFCWRCDTRYVFGEDGRRTEVRLSDRPLVALGADTVRLFRIGATAWAAAEPAAGVRVDGEPVPDAAYALRTADTLRIGWPDGERLALTPEPAQHRLDITFASGQQPGWILPQADDEDVRVLVSATTGDPLAGTMPVINPAAAAPGGGRQPYGGALVGTGGSWQWVADGLGTPLASGAAELLPRPDRERAAGHIVRIRQHDMDAATARYAVVIAWLAGVLALAWLWRTLHPHALALRVAAAGAIHSLIAVRGTLAFRAWLAPPHDASSPITFIALLIGLPALAVVLHLWPRIAAARREHVRRDAGVAGGLLLAAAVAVTALVLPEWRSDLLVTIAAAVAIPAAALGVLNLLLLGRAGLSNPLAAVASPAQEGYTHRQFLSALLLLGALGFLLLVITQLLRFGTLIAVVAWAIMFAATLVIVSGPRVLVRPRTRVRPAFTAAVTGVGAAAIALLFGLGAPGAVLALAAGAAVGGAIAVRSTFRLRPVHLRDVVGPPLLLVVAASLAAVLMPGMLGSLRVVAEYVLAMAGLIVVTRIFTILWFRHMQQLARQPLVRRRRAELTGFVRAGVVALLALAAVYLPLTVFDPGLVLLFFAATTAVVFVALHVIGPRPLAALVPVAIVAVFFLGMFVRPSSLETGTAEPGTAQIRYAATYHPEALQRHILASPQPRSLESVRTLQQYWGVRHYAAAGMEGRGYFGSAYASWIVPRPVALTENAFSTFLVSEHGWYGAAAVLLAYLTLALALLYGAVRSAGRTGTAPHALLLVGIAAFWLVPALYIAGANGVLLPLTGQNMPLLGLLSSADVVLACWLAALGLYALPVDGDAVVEHVRSDGWTRRLRAGVVIVGAVFVLATTALLVLLLRPIRAEVGDFSLDAVVAGVESLVDQGALVAVRGTPTGDSIAVAASAAAHPHLAVGGFVRGSVQRANRLARGEPGGAGCLEADALVRIRSDGGIATHGGLCSLRAAREARQDWTGALVAAASHHDFVLSDGRTAVVLDPTADGEAVIGGRCAAPGSRRARAVRLGCDAAAPLLRYATSAPVLESAGTAAVELNGVPAAVPTLIRSGDHVRVGGAADVWAMQLAPGAVSYARWENAVSRRVTDARLTPWLVQLDTQLARGLANREQSAWDARLTLRPALQAQLQTALATACSAVPGVSRCSALLADPERGDILALAAAGAPQPHRFLPADPNLRNHPAASAIKPILAAAALHAYPQLRTLEVEHAAAEYHTIANTAVQPSMRAARLYPSSRVTLTGYIGASDNLYSATLGFLATSARGADDLPDLDGGVDQSGLRLNGSPLQGRPSWARSARMDLGSSPLAEALQSLFSVHVRSTVTPAYDREFWSAAVGQGALIASGDVQRITPEPVGLDMDRFRSPRELAAFTIGGDRNRWNNVALVQAISRIYSGRAVDLHIVTDVGPHPIRPDPRPYALSGAARAAVLDGMKAVTQESWGTASGLRTAFPAGVNWRAKTGTLREPEWVGSIFLFAGGPASERAPVCAAAGIVTIEFAAGASPDGRATQAFREAIAPLLRRHLGWGDAPCRERES